MTAERPYIRVHDGMAYLGTVPEQPTAPCLDCRPMSPEDVHVRRDHEHGWRGAVSYCARCQCTKYRPRRWWRRWLIRRPALPRQGAAGCADPDPPQGGLRS